MLESGNDPDLFLEAGPPFGWRDIGIEHLQDNLPSKGSIGCEVDRGHAPAIDQTLNIVAVGQVPAQLLEALIGHLCRFLA